MVIELKYSDRNQTNFVNSMAIPGMQTSADVMGFQKSLSQELPLSEKTEPAFLKPRLKVRKVSLIAIKLDSLRDTFQTRN